MVNSTEDVGRFQPTTKFPFSASVPLRFSAVVSRQETVTADAFVPDSFRLYATALNTDDPSKTTEDEVIAPDT
jgi:hypothetical protein